MSFHVSTQLIAKAVVALASGDLCGHPESAAQPSIAILGKLGPTAECAGLAGGQIEPAELEELAMVGKPSKVPGLGEDGQRVDGTDARDHTKQLVVTVLAEHGMGGSLDLVALADQTARLRDDHAKHDNRHGILVDRQCDRCAGGLVNIVD